MLATVSALRTFGNTQVSLDKMIGRVDEIRSVSSFLRDGLESTVVGSGSGSGLGFGGKKAVLAYFKGGAREFQWKASMLFGESYGGTFLVRVAQEGGKLVLQWQRPPMPIESATWKGELSRVLVERLQELQISYRGEDDRAWLAVWEGAGSPENIRLNIKADDRYWPELIMTVQR
jgi:general secretion pathway protein J